MGMHLLVILGDQGLCDAWCLVRAKSPMSFNIPWAVVLKVSHLHPTPVALVPPEFVRQAKTQVPQMDWTSNSGEGPSTLGLTSSRSDTLYLRTTTVGCVSGDGLIYLGHDWEWSCCHIRFLVTHRVHLLCCLRKGVESGGFRFLSCWKNKITLNEKFICIYFAVKSGWIQLVKCKAIRDHFSPKFQMSRFVCN